METDSSTVETAPHSTCRCRLWLSLLSSLISHPFLCKYAQPCIQCVTDFFKNGCVCSRLWDRSMEVHTCSFAFHCAHGCGCCRLQWCACQLHLCHLCPFDKGKTLVVITVGSSVRVTMYWLLVCFSVVWLLIFLWVAAVFSLTLCVSSCTRFSHLQYFLTEILHFVLLAHISCSRPWYCLEQVSMLWVHTFPNSVTLYYGGIRAT